MGLLGRSWLPFATIMNDIPVWIFLWKESFTRILKYLFENLLSGKSGRSWKERNRHNAHVYVHVFWRARISFLLQFFFFLNVLVLKILNSYTLTCQKLHRLRIPVKRRVAFMFRPLEEGWGWGQMGLVPKGQLLPQSGQEHQCSSDCINTLPIGTFYNW